MTDTTNMQVVNEQEWITLAGMKILTEIIVPMGFDTNGNTGRPVFDDLKMARGYPPKGATKNRGRVIGVCIDPVVSLKGFTEIFISPFVHDPMEMLGTLVHELGHAVLGGEAAHGPKFKQFCEDVGLDGPKDHTGNHVKVRNWQLATTVKDGSPLHKKLTKILKSMPPFPGAGLDLTEVEKRRKAAGPSKTLMLKEYCDNAKCPYYLSEGKVNIARATWSVIRKAGCHTCTKCGTIMVVVLPTVNGKPQEGDDGQPIDPDVPPAMVNGHGDGGEPEPLPEDVRVAGQDTTPNGKPKPGALKDGPTTSVDSGEDTPTADPDDGDTPSEPDDAPSDEQGETAATDGEAEEEVEVSPKAENGPDAGFSSGGDASKVTRRYKGGIKKHAVDMDCDKGENGGPCDTCLDAMRMAGLDV